jgi:hypothetical protein
MTDLFVVTPLSMLLYAPEHVSSIRGVLLKGLLGEGGGPHVESGLDFLFGRQRLSHGKNVLGECQGFVEKVTNLPLQLLFTS